MHILAINCGSSTLKFELFQIGPDRARKRRVWGLADRIGIGGSIDVHRESAADVKESVVLPDHGEAARRVLGYLQGCKLGAVVHRVVHGGERFIEPTLIDEAVVAEIDKLTELAPLHNGPALAALKAARSALGTAVPMVAVFDTAWHRTMPPHAALYPIPHELTERYRIQRYGFHGIAHRWMAERCAELIARPLDQLRLVTLQLGNGCSATALARGRSIDTSMGFTPLEGLMMGTRSGDIDPSLVGYLAEHEEQDVAVIEDWLNRRSGLLGVSGHSRDMRELLDLRRQGNPRATLAVDMFAYRVKKYVGAYLAALGGADALVFGGGIGENAPVVRSLVCAGMEWSGLLLDEARNQAAIGVEGRISADGSKMLAFAIPVDEAAILVKDALHSLNRAGHS
jgi:acetate kinase